MAWKWVEVFQHGSSSGSLSENGLAVLHATFAIPGLTTLCGLDELGLVGRVADRCASCVDRVPSRRSEGLVLDLQAGRRLAENQLRRLAHVPFGWRPTTLLWFGYRRRFSGCGRSWQHDLFRAAEPRSRPSRRALGRLPPKCVYCLVLEVTLWLGFETMEYGFRPKPESNLRPATLRQIATRVGSSNRYTERLASGSASVIDRI